MNEIVDSIVESELVRLRAIAPFDQIPSELLLDMLTHAGIVYFPPGKVICQPTIADRSRLLWIVRKGSVRAMPPDAEASEAMPEELLEVGSLLPLESVMRGQAPSRVYAAAEDCFLWQLEAAMIERLLSEPGFLRWFALVMHDLNTRLREIIFLSDRDRQVSEQALALPAKHAGTESIAFVAREASIAQVAAMMAARHIGSVVVGSTDAVEGIVTQSDMLRRVIAEGLPYETPVAEIMTTQPEAIDETSTVIEAGIEMAKRRIRHLLVRDSGGSLVAVVSERDLFQAQQHGITRMFAPIDEAQSLDEMVEIAARVREFASRVYRQGMAVSQFMRMLSSINDRLTQRLLTLVMSQKQPVSGFCWLAFGSEGREEQGFVTDQDNGIVFQVETREDTERTRAALLDLASSMNDALHECGFERCKGNIMAGNPLWCLTLEEWKAKFSNWIDATTPAAILNSTIFFDFRAIFGDADLAEALRDHLAVELRGNTLFIAMMAKNALEVAPPIGTITRFKTDNNEHKGLIDLKTQGVRLFADVGRIYALAHSVRTANTEQRLRVAGRKIRRSSAAIDGDIAAFRFLQGLRIKRQLDSIRDGGAANRIDPYRLNDLEQRMLRESLRQAQSLQERVKLDYQL